MPSFEPAPAENIERVQVCWEKWELTLVAQKRKLRAIRHLQPPTQLLLLHNLAVDAVHIMLTYSVHTSIAVCFWTLYLVVKGTCLQTNKPVSL